jgi:hypothetical protein
LRSITKSGTLLSSFGLSCFDLSALAPNPLYSGSFTPLRGSCRFASPSFVSGLTRFGPMPSASDYVLLRSTLPSRTSPCAVPSMLIFSPL